MKMETRQFFAANWKMHKGPRATTEFVERFKKLHRPRSEARVVFFPPSISVGAFRDGVRDRPDIEVGVQDVHAERDGAHTGAISAPMAREAGATWALVGHSERRREFADDDAAVAAKTSAIMAAGMFPILCVGETLEEREAGDLEAVLARQLRAVLEAIDPEQRQGLTYAYEPVWAIGTGRTASPDDATEAHRIVRREIVASGGSESCIVLYGGSVKPGNIQDLLCGEGVDGVLVGGASLDPEGFAAICAAG